MNALIGSAAPASGPEIPEFATLAADPEIAPLLRFDPVVRKVKRPDGWTPELQRELVARIAATGTVQSAVWQMGKHATGAEALYKTPGATSFRQSWDAAIIIGRRRNGLDSQPPFLGEVPGITRRAKLLSSAGGGPFPEPEPEMSNDLKMELMEKLGAKFLRKVMAEREARLAGRIVAADFYLRQITMIEILFDLTASKFGWDAQEVLRNLRRGGHRLLEVVETPFSTWLDNARRVYWEEQGDPPRPQHPDPRLTVKHGEGPWGNRGAGGWSTAVDDRNYGALSHPARGYSQEEWAKMDNREQELAREKQNAEDAEEQRSWEAAARADWQERQGAEDRRAQSVRGD
ncbi:hypothetical protein [Sphingomonas hankyongi]|uniref:Uncharacterized protein n=1 Tax=Sphingomonas hankyongi TaxID=2908209 RepID=A0ABT0S0T0_9SPHN|nr:hypothetical protein [Sphingomonas hankyongi]MCL6729253.1 hypothetical protein [Sphingomonas hankyongi]